MRRKMDERLYCCWNGTLLLMTYDKQASKNTNAITPMTKEANTYSCYPG
jgi:hypothetical protein